MHPVSKWLPARLAAPVRILVSLAILCAAPGMVSASDDEPHDASAHVLQAELALHRQDYRVAASEYRKAAALSESVDIARQATRIGTSYGFNEDALASADLVIGWNSMLGMDALMAGVAYLEMVSNTLVGEAQHFFRFTNSWEPWYRLNMTMREKLIENAVALQFDPKGKEADVQARIRNIVLSQLQP